MRACRIPKKAVLSGLIGICIILLAVKYFGWSPGSYELCENGASYLTEEEQLMAAVSYAVSHSVSRYGMESRTAEQFLADFPDCCLIVDKKEGRSGYTYMTRVQIKYPVSGYEEQPYQLSYYWIDHCGRFVDYAGLHAR